MEDGKKLHIVVFPWLAFGHMIPFLELSKSLASKGHHISYISTPRNVQRLEHKIPLLLAPSITLVSFPLPRHESLPLDAEATTDVGSAQGSEDLKVSFDGLQEPITKFLESKPVDWIIYDFASYWLPPVAGRLGIKKVYFCIYFSRTLASIGPSADMGNDGAGAWTSPEIITRPLQWIPFPGNNVYYRPYEARNMFSAITYKSSGFSAMFRVKTCMNGCDVIAVRSSMELEGQYLELTGKLNNKVVLPVGLMPAAVEQSEQEGRTWQTIGGWLDQQKPGSVVYVAQGSEFELEQEGLNELALGLELSGVPFFWSLRKPVNDGSAKLPFGFEERTQGRGVVWSRWAPQPRILAHDSVGGFLTHCGWSSIIESLQFGKPLIMLPLAIDHGLYARFMVEKNVGIEIPRNEEDGSFTRSSVMESIRQVLQDNRYKNEAKKLSKIVADQSLQAQYIDKFVEHLQSTI